MSTTPLLITDRELIRKEWGKTAEDIKKEIEIIREWLKTQKHLPEVPSDNMIEFFMTNCKYSIEKTKQNLDMYYTVRQLMPDIYKGCNPCKPSEVEAAYATANIVFLPKLTPELYRVQILKYKDIEPEKSDVKRLCALYFNNFYEIRIHEDLAMGDINIIDFTHVKIGVLTKITPVLIQQWVKIWEKVQSSRLKGIYLMFAPEYVNTIVAICKSFLSKKLKERIWYYKTSEELYQKIPQDTLPSDYGGKEKSISELAELWKKKMYEYQDRFDKLDTLKVNEELRPEKLENDEILGYYGNFKKMSVD